MYNFFSVVFSYPVKGFVGAKPVGLLGLVLRITACILKIGPPSFFYDKSSKSLSHFIALATM
jgi:hypothetical protein